VVLAAQVVSPEVARVALPAAAQAELLEVAQAELPAAAPEACAVAVADCAVVAAEVVAAPMRDACCREYRKRRGKLSPRSSCSSPKLKPSHKRRVRRRPTQAAVRISHL